MADSNLEPSREDIIINNILSEICSCTPIKEDQYLPWLKLEIGLSDAEIDHLKEVNCLPMP